MPNLETLTDAELDALLLSTDKAYEEAVLELRRRYLAMKDAASAPEAEPTVPAEPIDHDPPFQAVKTVPLDPHESPYDQAKRLSAILEPGTRLVIPEGGRASTIKLGGGNQPTLMADLTPVRDIEITGAGILEGLHLYPEIAGSVRVSGVSIQPASNGDKACIATKGECYGLHLDLRAIDFDAFPGSDRYQGFGLMWNVVIQGGRLTGRDLSFAAALEHGLYAMNTRGVDIERFGNRTRIINGVELGMGRTLAKHENRIHTESLKSSGTLGGAPSSGDVRFAHGTAIRCGHEGVIQGRQPKGGSDYTIGGHTGALTKLDKCSSVDPFCGGIAIFQENSAIEITADNPAGVRVWQIAQPPLGERYPSESITWSVDMAEIIDYTQTRTSVPMGRTPMLLSGMRELHMNNPQGLPFVLNHQAGVPPIAKEVMH